MGHGRNVYQPITHALVASPGLQLCEGSGVGVAEQHQGHFVEQSESVNGVLEPAAAVDTAGIEPQRAVRSG